MLSHVEHKAPPLSLAVACALLTLAVLLSYPIIGWFAYARSGTLGLVAAAVAAGVTWLGASLALVTTTRLARYGGKQQSAAVNGILLGMIFRMGLPLAAGVLLSTNHGPLADADVFGLIVVFYLVTLVVETLLALRLVDHSKPRKGD